MGRQIFRQSALDRLQSPEQLDQLIEWAPRRAVPRVEWAALRDGLRRRGGRGIQRVTTPTVLQMESVECGAAALAMVLGFHGRVVPLAELRVICGVTRDGSKASNLIKAAQQYGLKAKGFKKEPVDLPTLPLPQIAFWNFNHFVVVEGFGPDRVYLNDPASGRRVVSSAEFDEAFTGVVLVFAPGPDFAPGGSHDGATSALRRRLAGQRRALQRIGMFSLLLALPSVALPVFAQLFVDRIVVRGTSDLLVALLIGMALTALLRGMLSWFQVRELARFAAALSRDESARFLRHVLFLPIAFFAQRSPGEVSARMALHERVANTLAGPLAGAAGQLLLLTLYGLLMLLYDWRLTLVVLLGAAVELATLLILARRGADRNRRLLHDQGQLAGQTYSGLQLIESIKASGSEADSFARWAGYQARAVNAELGLASSVERALPVLVLSLTTGAVLLLGAARVMSGALSVGMLVAFQSLAASTLATVADLAMLGSLWQSLHGALDRLDDVLRYPAIPEADRDDQGTSSSDQLSGLLELRNVTFGYSRMEVPLIDGVSLTLRPGQQVALVGGSGSGKSTVAKLVAGLYEPWSGEILFDGAPRHAWPRERLTSSLAMVDQDLFLFTGSVRDNLTLWDANVADDDVRHACDDAALRDLLDTLPGGLAATIDEDGHNLSGGQRQRLEIARALVRRPSVLVLDEATSALDPLTESAVVANIRRRGCACLIVAHRLSTIRDADEIVVLEQGRVVQRGTHAELVRVPGPYAALLAADEPRAESVVPPLAGARA